MSKKTTVKKRCAIHPRPQGDEVFWHSFIKKECGEEVSKLKTLIEEYRQKLILKDEQIKVISEDNKLLAKLVGEKYGQNSGS